MFKNITQYIRHNLKTGRAIIILVTAVMLICGPIPLFMEFGNRLDNFEYRVGTEKIEYAKIIERNLLSTFDMTDEYYSILLSLIAAVAGLVLAYVLFFHFRKKNSADFFLSLPLTRTETYIANFISGIIYYVIPLILTSAVTIIGLNIMGSWKFVNISRLLFMSSETGVVNGMEYTGMFAMLGNNLAFFLLFFAIGTVAVLLTSNGINSLVVYGTINFYPIVFMFLLLASAEIFNNDIIDFSDKILYDFLPITPIVRVLAYSELAPTAWTYVTAITAAVLIGVLGCFICNIRPAESWSSAIVFKPLRLLLQYMYCFIVAFAGGLFFYAVSDNSLINIIVGSIVGLVVSFMVLNIIFERDVKAIFKKPLRLLWSALIFIVVFIVIVVDAFGIFRYREPSPAQVDYVNVSLNHSLTTSNFNYLDNDNSGLSKLESEKDKAAAIALYTLLHEQIRNDNYSYLFRNGNNNATLDNLAYFDVMANNYMGYRNHIVVRMMKDGKEIRPLRNNYFPRTEQMYELYKAIYDAQPYTDPILNVLENAQLVYAQPSTVTLDKYGMSPKQAILDTEILEALRLALIEDYKSVTFDQLQDTSVYTLELLYNLNQKYYSVTSPEVVVVEQTEAVVSRDRDVLLRELEYERQTDISIPACFKNTLMVLEENFDIEAINNLTLEANEKVGKIVVEVYSDDAPVKITEVTDRGEINRILADRISGNSRAMTFPKRGVILRIYPENLDDYYSDDYIEKYNGDIKALEESAVSIDFLKRTSTLY